jgi:glutamine synthetase
MIPKNVRAFVRRNHIRFFDLKYTDALGRLHHVTTPVERLERVSRDGIGFDSSSVPGLKAVECGDMSLFPDFATLFVDPFAAEPTASCLADIREPGEKKPHALDPRQILRAALALARKRLRCDDVCFLPEFEFYLLDKVSYLSDKDSVYYRLTSRELSRDDESGYIGHGSAYHAAPPLDRSSDLRTEMCRLAGACGVPMKYHHHEGGRFSHVELEPELQPGLKAADGVVLVKYIVKNVAIRSGRTATFMPKPIFGEPGSGMHFHQYAVRNGVSLFGDRRSPVRLSRLALQYIGGILHHAPSLCALTNPSTNSYKRLIPGFEAPAHVFFSVSNRTAAIRIPGYVVDADQMVIEYRIPDGMCNPYLAMAAMVLAGVDGVMRKLDPGESFSGKAEEAARAFGDRELPRTLRDAVAALEEDSDYLRRDGIFPAGLLDYWCCQKRSESEQVLRRPHPWEYNLYYGQ